MFVDFVFVVVVIINTNETDICDKNLFTKLEFMNDHRMTRKLHIGVNNWKGWVMRREWEREREKIDVHASDSSGLYIWLREARTFPEFTFWFLNLIYILISSIVS